MCPLPTRPHANRRSRSPTCHQDGASANRSAVRWQPWRYHRGLFCRDARRERQANRHADAGGRISAASGVPDDARILEGEGTGLQSSAQLSTVGACLSKGSPRRNLEKTTGANRVWSEGSCDLSRCRSQWPASEVKRNG